MKKELQAFDIDGTLIVAPTLAEALKTYKAKYDDSPVRAEMVGTYIQTISDRCLNASGRDGIICCSLFSINNSMALICADDMFDAVSTYDKKIHIEDVTSVKVITSYDGSELAYLSKTFFED